MGVSLGFVYQGTFFVGKTVGVFGVRNTVKIKYSRDQQVQYLRRLLRPSDIVT